MNNKVTDNKLPSINAPNRRETMQTELLVIMILLFIRMFRHSRRLYSKHRKVGLLNFQR